VETWDGLFTYNNYENALGDYAIGNQEINN
jgi:hypothetical protein